MKNKFLNAYYLSEELREKYYQLGYWTHENFWTSFCEIVKKHPNKVAVIDHQGDVSFQQLMSSAQSFGESLCSVNTCDRDVILIHARHSINAVTAILGCIYSNRIPALLPPMFSAEQITTIMKSTNSPCIVALGQDSEIESCIASSRAVSGTLVITFDDSETQDSIGWTRFIQKKEVTPVIRDNLNPDDLMMLIYSSGTTGAPKGVMHSANTTRFTVKNYSAMQNISHEDVSLVVTAFGFVGSSILGFFLSLLTGCTTVLLQKWSPELALEQIEKYRVTHLLLMPTHAIDIMRSSRLDHTDCSSLMRGVVAGVNRDYREDAKKRLCQLPFPMYGMSESPAHITGSMTDEWKDLISSEGRNMPGTDLLICDDEDRPVPSGQSGHILVRGPNRFLGYYNSDELNKSSLTDEGYFRTGDIGVLSEDGFMTFISRSKDIIRRGGVTLTPSDIEEVIRMHPRVSNVAVIGLPDDRLGERACACLITRDGAELSLEEIISYLEAEGLPKYLWPEVVVQRETFPLTPSLKVQKVELKKQVLESMTKVSEHGAS